METSSLKMCNLLCAEMHICLSAADPWLPLRLSEITKECVLKALSFFFFFNVQSAELTVLKPSVLFFRVNRCSRMRTEHRSASFPYCVEPPCSRPLGIDSAFLCGWSSQLKMVERNPNITDFLNLLVSQGLQGEPRTCSAP